MLTRRSFLQMSSLAGVGLGSGIVGFSKNSSEDLELVEKKFKFPRLPDALHGYKIGFLTDLHFGVWVSHELIERAVSMLQKHAVDLLILGGDYLWIPESILSSSFPGKRNAAFLGIDREKLPAPILSELFKIISQLKPRDGTFGIFGNHDRWVAPATCQKTMASAKINLLVNQQIEISRGNARLSITGVDDYWTGVPQIPIENKRKSFNQFRLLLAHNPDYVSELLTETNFDFDLALCGHTHGGQINLPLLGPIFFNVQDLRFANGLYESSHHKVYTSRGLGVVEIPYRINCRPEVTLIHLLST